MFMQPQALVGDWLQVTHSCGETCIVPADGFGPLTSLEPVDVLDYVDAPDVESIDEIELLRHRIGVRLSALGYMDCTDWTLCEDAEDARAQIADLLDMGEGQTEDGDDVDRIALELLPEELDGQHNVHGKETMLHGQERRKDHDLRRRVDDVPEGTSEEVRERRRRQFARGELTTGTRDEVYPLCDGTFRVVLEDGTEQACDECQTIAHPDLERPTRTRDED